VRGSQLASEKLGLAGNAKGRSSLGGLEAIQISSSCANRRNRSYLESILLQTVGQAGERLVTSSGLGNNGQRRGRSLSIFGSDLESVDVGSLVRSGGGCSGGSKASARHNA
jgi:hypothetical protein